MSVNGFALNLSRNCAVVFLVKVSSGGDGLVLRKLCVSVVLPVPCCWYDEGDSTDKYKPKGRLGGRDKHTHVLGETPGTPLDAKPVIMLIT